MHISYNRMIVGWYKKTKSSVLHAEVDGLLKFNKSRWETEEI